LVEGEEWAKIIALSEESWASFRLRFQPVGLTGRRVELQLGERED